MINIVWKIIERLDFPRRFRTSFFVLGVARLRKSMCLTDRHATVVKVTFKQLGEKKNK